MKKNKSNNNALKKLAAKLTPISLIATALLTSLVWLNYRSDQTPPPLSFSWLNLLIWLLASALTVALVQKFIYEKPLVSKALKKNASKYIPSVVLFKFLRNMAVSIATSLPALALVGFFIISDTYFRYSILDSAKTWLSGYGWFFVVTFIVLTAVLAIGILIIRLGSTKKLLAIAFSGALTVIVCVLAYIPAYNQTKQLASTVQTIGNAIAGQRLSSAANLNFNAYKPSYLPSGWSLNTGSLYGPSLNSADTSEGTPENFELTFFGNDDPTEEIFMDSYPAPANYNPPTNCGTDARNYYSLEDSHKCVFIGHSASGCNVYYVSYSNDDNEAYCRLGNTVVGSYIYSSLVPGASVTSKAQYKEVLNIYDSLQMLTTQQTQQLIDQTNSQD